MHRLCAAVLLALTTLWAGVAQAADWPPRAADLAATIMSAAPNCQAASDCGFLVRIENLGTADYAGPIAITATSTVAAVLGPGKTPPWSCARKDFRSFACTLAAGRLGPGQTIDLALVLRMLPSPLAEAQDCVALDWPASKQTLRDGVVRATLSALGKTVPGDLKAPAATLRAVLGGWGDGDPRAANDSDCTKVGLGPVLTLPNCAAGESPLNGACVALASFCTGGRSFDAAKGNCACPVGQPAFDPASRSCAAALQPPQCPAGQTAANGFCVCPASAPLWNAKTAACGALDLTPASVEVTPSAAAKVAVAEPVKVAASPIVPQAERPAKIRAPRVRRLSCGDGRCGHQYPLVHKHWSLHRTRQVPRIAAHAACPPLFVYNSRANYCWPALWIDPDILVHGPIPKTR